MMTKKEQNAGVNIWSTHVREAIERTQAVKLFQRWNIPRCHGFTDVLDVVRVRACMGVCVCVWVARPYVHVHTHKNDIKRASLHVDLYCCEVQPK